MHRNKMIGIALWLMGFALVNVLAFCLTRGFTPTFWIMAGFMWTAFVSVLVFQLLYWGKNKMADVHVLKVPSVIIAIIYLVLQFPVCIAFSIGAEVISAKAALVINFVILIAAWSTALLTIWDTGKTDLSKRRG